MKDRPENQGAPHMPWRQRLEKMRESGELDIPPEDLPDVPEPTIVQEERVKIEKRLRAFKEQREETKRIAAMMEDYKENSDSCSYCSGASSSGCRYCSSGKIIASLYARYSRDGRLDDWNKWWGNSKNLAA